jgi:hypothetical protein
MKLLRKKAMNGSINDFKKFKQKIDLHDNMIIINFIV